MYIEYWLFIVFIALGFFWARGAYHEGYQEGYEKAKKEYKV